MARAMQIGSLVVDLIAESAQYIAELQKANRETRKWSRDVSRSFSNLASGIAAAAAGYLSLSAAISTANQLMADAKEIENMARLAGLSVEEFQAATYAVDQYGISAEKLGDIGKDVSDKLGDFIATGGGEFADFFEKVAPKVGLTAEELQHLSGPEVLQAVKNAMDQANIPMKQQIFYLESIANDASLLIPLLKDGGQAYRELTQEAHDLNIVMSDQDISNLREMDKLFSQVSKQLQTSFAQAVTGASEQIIWLTDVISKSVRGWGILFDSFSDKPKLLVNVRNEIDDTREAIEELKGSLGSYKKHGGGGIGSLFDSLLGDVKGREDILKEIEALEALEKELMQRYTELYQAANQSIEIPEQPTIKLLSNESFDPVEAANKEAEAIISANQRVLDSLATDLASQEELIWSTYTERINAINDLVLTETQVQEAGFETVDQLRIAYIQKADADRKASLERLKEDTKAATTEMESQFAQLANSINANTETMESAATSWGNSFSSELANMVTTGELDFSRLAESIINDLIRIAIQANVTNQLLSVMGLAGSSTGSTPAAKATGGPVMKGSTYLVGEQGPELFTTSSSGNIIPNNQLGGGSTQVNVYTQPGETAETQTRSTPQGDVVEIFMKQVDSRMNEQISRGQGLARTLESRYSLNRRSY